jgi:hypothetical protein
VSIEWDGWPDGHFEQDFTFKEYNRTGRLKVHWAHKIGGGDRKGNSHAKNWENGKQFWRQCLGVLKCDNCQGTSLGIIYAGVFWLPYLFPYHHCIPPLPHVIDWTINGVLIFLSECLYSIAALPCG